MHKKWEFSRKKKNAKGIPSQDNEEARSPLAGQVAERARITHIQARKPGTKVRRDG